MTFGFARIFKRLGQTGLALLIGLGSMATDSYAIDTTKPARELFGGVTLPTKGNANPYGFYAKGCLAGGVAIPTDGPTWQAMRLSRNRRWGHPQMIALIERLSKDAAKYDGWPGLLLGDISQPRGGPMLGGHASHQIGLDADIWLTPMPARQLSGSERENISATSMLKKNAFLKVDANIWTPAHARLLMRAASYPQVERIFVNPAIKKKLCETWTGDRTAMGKIRPYYGHDYHFHIRIHCPPDAVGCKGQAPVAAGDGCDKSLAWWFTQEPWAKPGKKDPDPDAKPVKPRYTMLSELPKACAVVLDGTPASESAATFGKGTSSAAAFAKESTPPQSLDSVIQSGPEDGLPAVIPIPLTRPIGQ